MFLSLSTEDNIKLLKQLESGLKRAINWNKYKSKLTEQAQSRYLDYFIDQSFQRINRLFIWSFEDGADRKVCANYCLPKREIKDYNVMIGEEIFFITQWKWKNDMITFKKLQLVKEMNKQLAAY